MKILYLITRAEPGGAQVHLLELIKGFREKAELHLAVGSDKDDFLVGEAKGLGITVCQLRNMVHPLHPGRDIQGLSEIMQIIRRLKPDLIHAHSSKAGFLGRLAAKLEGLPSIFTAHGWAFTEGVPFPRRFLALAMEKIAGRLGGTVIAVSHHDANLALRYGVVSPARLKVVWNGIPDVPYRADPSLNPPKIAMVARFSPPKDHTLLLRALAPLRHLPWELVLVGDGPLLPEVKELAHNLGIAHRVNFLGKRLDVPQILSSAQIFVLVSKWEGLPISLLEAMRAGLPVVASDVGGVGEAVKEGHNGFLISRGDEETLRSRLQTLIVDSALRLAMGRQGRRLYESHFTVSKMLQETWKIYEEVLSGRGD